jgi:SLOG in TRPM, prokaryote
VYKEGLAHAASTVKSVVVSGGSDSGVMKLTGSALAGHNVTLIGIATLQKMLGFESPEGLDLILNASPKSVIRYEYKTALKRPVVVPNMNMVLVPLGKSEVDGARLNRHHTVRIRLIVLCVHG